LPEVEAVCDRVGIIREGELIQTSTVDALTKQAFKRLRLTLRTAATAGSFDAIDGVTETGRNTNEIDLEVRANIEQVMRTALTFGLEDLDVLPVTLEEIFLAFYERGKGGKHA
ncbi:MAG: ABC transporter ATP-binding protein, partial [Candidatus Promineifilaceae bacterium]